MNMQDINSIRKSVEKFKLTHEFAGRILFDEPMKNRTSFKIGGNAPLFVEPANENSLIGVLDFFKTENIPYFILGGCTNVVVSDDGFEGAVISTSGLNYIEILDTGIPAQNAANSGKNVFVKCGAGTPVSSLINFCRNNCLQGAEQFAGLPGSVGGAVFMNARCFDRSISDLFHSADFIDMHDNAKSSFLFKESDWAYKVSPFQNTNKIITSVVFRLTQCSIEHKADILERCEYYINQRKIKGHFKFPSAGSVFRNNRSFGKSSGQIIDEAGLKGMKIGGAQIAPWHGNFIINTGNASQKDVKELVNFIVNVVKEKRNFVLQPEIIFCGK